jgi:hypothetical protein
MVSSRCIVCGSVDASYAIDCLCGIHIVNVSLYGEGGQHGGDVARIQRVNVGLNSIVLIF